MFMRTPSAPARIKLWITSASREAGPSVANIFAFLISVRRMSLCVLWVLCVFVVIDLTSVRLTTETQRWHRETQSIQPRQDRRHALRVFLKLLTESSAQ